MIKTLKRIARKIPGISFVYHILCNRYAALQLKSKNTEDVFTDIYRENKWGGKYSVSGPGSDDYQTRIIAQKLPALLNEFNISTVLDIPCGDFLWMKSVDLKRVHYTGADIVKDLIQTNKERYEGNNIHFQNLDLIRDKLPTVDLIFCRDCLVHLSYEDILLALQNIRKSQSEYLLATTFTDRKNNDDILTGQWRALNLEVAPFMLPKPLMIINEGCTEGEGAFEDKALGLWRIADL
jgi:hypothetical protein